jgi:chorismate mutase
MAGRLALLFAMGLLLPAVAGFPTAPPRPIATPAQERLLLLMKDRLLLMEDVARWKWTHHKAIADPEREQALLRDVEEQARPAGLDPEFTCRFFRGQIEAG